MSGTMPWSQSPPNSMTNDPGDVLGRIDRNLVNMGMWMKVLVVLVFIVLAINVLFLI
jgi:hypothetical protein